jgi:hypothetical protein
MRRFGSALVALSAMIVSLTSAHAAPTQQGASVKSICAVGSVRPISILLREKIKAQYIAAGHKNVFAFVSIKPGRSTATPVSYANIQGISSITVSSDGTGVQIAGGAAPVSLSCNVELPVTIKVSFSPAGSQGPRKTVTATQNMNFEGSFR